MGSTYDVSPDPYNNVVPFNFAIGASSVLSSLNAGTATLSVVQESQYVIRLSQTTLTMTTAAVPEPSTLALLAAGALGLLGCGWRRRMAAGKTAKLAAFDQPNDSPILSLPSHSSPPANAARRAA